MPLTRLFGRGDRGRNRDRYLDASNPDSDPDADGLCVCAIWGTVFHAPIQNAGKITQSKDTCAFLLLAEVTAGMLYM